MSPAKNTFKRHVIRIDFCSDWRIQETIFILRPDEMAQNFETRNLVTFKHFET